MKIKENKVRTNLTLSPWVRKFLRSLNKGSMSGTIEYLATKHKDINKVTMEVLQEQIEELFDDKIGSHIRNTEVLDFCVQASRELTALSKNLENLEKLRKEVGLSYEMDETVKSLLKNLIEKILLVCSTHYWSIGDLLEEINTELKQEIKG